MKEEEEEEEEDEKKKKTDVLTRRVREEKVRTEQHTEEDTMKAVRKQDRQ